MENLKYPKEHFLINNPDSEDVISIGSAKKLLFPNLGITLDPAVDEIEVMYSGNGHSNGVFLGLNEKATVQNGETFSFGFAVRRKERLPGIRNPYPDPNMNGRPYYSEIKSLNVTSGNIDATDQELILSKLLAIIDADKNNPESQYFNIKKAYYVSLDSAAATASVDVIIDGSSTTYDNGATYTTSALADVVNAGGKVIALAVSDTMMLFLSNEVGGDFVIDANTNTTNVKKGLVVYGTSIETKALTYVDTDFMTPEDFTLITLNYAAISTTAQGAFTINYGKSSDGTNVQSAVSVASSGAAVTAVKGHNKDIYPYALGDVLYLSNWYGYSGDYKTGSIILSYTSILEYGINALHGGVFPMTTSDDIFREQAGIYNGMGAAVRQEQALVGDEYVVLNFTKKGSSPALSSGASSKETYETKYSVAINKSSMKAVKWNSTFDGAGTSANVVAVIKNSFTGATFI